MTEITNIVSVMQKKQLFLKKPLSGLFWKYRLATWRSRSLPNFIIVGAQKAGTTSLFTYLSQHPQIVSPLKKEVHFFDRVTSSRGNKLAKGEAWYRAHFPMNKSINKCCQTFEASPSYIFNPLVPHRIFQLVPETKIIALLINPTERAISHYFHSVQLGREILSIREALQREEERLQFSINNQNYQDKSFINHSYKSRGLYKQQIERFLNYFSREQILILSSEDMFSEPDKVLREVFNFLGLNDFTIPNLKPCNVASNKTMVETDIYMDLNKFFKPHNRMLYELIGKEFDWEKY